MSDVSRYPARLPPEQEAFRAKCFHPSGTFVEFPREDVEHSVPARFEKIVGMYPDRIAIKLRGESLTYSELNCRANRLAQSLVDQYGDKAEPIAVLLENGPSLMAATLGVLKTGKFVVLMDSSFPDSRNAAILDDSGAKVVISEQENAPLVDRIASRDCRLMDIAATNSGVLTNDLRLRIPPDALAFLIYTSGSTGQPKGVMQDHRSRLRQYRWMTNTYHICAEDRSSLLNSGTAAAVDISLRPLMNGAMLLPFDLRREGVHRLACWLSHEKISLCVISSPLFRKLCETLSGEEGFPDLRLIRLSSETSYRSDFELYKKYFPPHCLLANGLSPTETGGLTVYFMDQRSYISGNEIPLGYALEDLKILLLDDDNRNVGFNQRGEIAVRSRYLSSGYWRRPALTEAKFKPDPGDKASRIYITGDLGIMLPDGCLLHKGRKDFRVKIRGYSVELAEVESVLRSHGAIDDAVVVARQHESGEARLIAYLTSSSEAPPTITDLRRFFEDRLPDYMIPSAFVTLDALPLTPSGKIDRAGLPDPEDFRRRLTTPLIAPRTCTEEKLAKIWARELHVDEIGVHDNFFDLGGHSLLAIRVVSLFCEDLQVEFSVSRFFKTPTVAGVADYIDMDHSVRDCVETPSIHGATKNEKLPLSFAQESLWFIDQLEPGRATYNLFSATRLTGPLDVRALEQSFNEIIRRHEALRTVFRTVDGVPFQIVLPTLTISLSVVDLRSIASAQEQEAEIGRICSKEAREPFDLARGPLLRVALLRLTAETYVLLLSVHHIVFDGSSRVVLDRELSILYRVFSRGESESLPALPAQYADFAQWQRRRLGNNHLKAQLAYWKKQLANPPVLHLPSDRPRPAVQTFEGGRESFTLSEDLVERLKKLGRKQGVTLFMTLVAAYATLLHRCAGQHDIAIGSPITGRNRSEFENLIGLCLNMLVLRTDLSGNPTFGDLLSRVRKVCLEAYANQDVPFDKLVQELQPQRSLSHNPLFQATFALQHTPICSLKLAGITAEDLNLGSGIANFDLHLFIAANGTDLSGWLVYSKDLFDAETISRMAGEFRRLLETIVDDPDRRISDFENQQPASQNMDERIGYTTMLPWEQRAIRARCFHPTGKFVAFPREDLDRTIPERFEKIVELYPDHPAVQIRDASLTYRELKEAADPVAFAVASLGSKSVEPVMLLCGDSFRIIFGCLAILKAGKILVLLDPSLGDERLREITENSQAGIILAHTSTFARACALAGDRCRVINLDELEASHRDLPSASPQITPMTPAVIVYSSGSTGQSKGVFYNHQRILHDVMVEMNAVKICSADRIIQLRKLSFGAGVKGLLRALLSGATLFPYDVLNDGFTKLPEFLRQNEITIFPPGVPIFRQFVSHLNGTETFPSIRLLTMACEAVSAQDIAAYKRIFSDDCVLLHHYSSSEAGLVCQYFIDKKTELEPGVVPIGYPVEGKTVFLRNRVDDQDRMGEITIRSRYLSSGYWRNRDLSEAKFATESTDSEQRVCLTGDYGRRLLNGALVFLGRKDSSVKVRGQTVQTAEIERVLSTHAGIQEARVIAFDSEPEEKFLVAYIVTVGREPLPVDSLRKFLRATLPDSMIPAHFIFLEAIPFYDGKVDRTALPKPDGKRPPLEQVYVSPQREIERTLIGIWEQVLNVRPIGVCDNFFDLGGHSLAATRVISELARQLRLEIPLKAMLDFPTVAAMATFVEMCPANKIIDARELGDILSELESISDERAGRLLNIIESWERTKST